MQNMNFQPPNQGNGNMGPSFGLQQMNQFGPGFGQNNMNQGPGNFGMQNMNMNQNNQHNMMGGS